MKAFPQVVKSIYGEENSEYGMDLRDYFAAKAMPIAFKFVKNALEDDDEVFEMCDPERDGWLATSIEVVAENCYLFADAMIKARKVDFTK